MFALAPQYSLEAENLVAMYNESAFEKMDKKYNEYKAGYRRRTGRVFDLRDFFTTVG